MTTHILELGEDAVDVRLAIETHTVHVARVHSPEVHVRPESARDQQLEIFTRAKKDPWREIEAVVGWNAELLVGLLTTLQPLVHLRQIERRLGASRRWLAIEL